MACLCTWPGWVCKPVEVTPRTLYSLGVFDISKAFDTANLVLRINKLEYYGIRGVPKQWVRDYLNDRNQFVSLRGIVSSSLGIISVA